MQIAIIDDEPKIRKGLMNLLQKQENWQVCGSFEEAQSALHFLQTHPVDVIITDICMPDLSGLELIRTLRQTNEEIEIVILSGYSDFAYAQTAIELGVRRYLTKPTNTKELLAVLDAAEQQLKKQLRSEQGEEPSAASNQTVTRAIHFIQKNYAQKLTLKEIADALHISPNYLCRLFKAHTGQGITEYITQYRMERAKKFLRLYDHRISDIAEMVGYKDTKYFSISFKKICNMTPVEYRNGKGLSNL